MKGSKNGFIFQKAYLEFFASRELLDILVKEISEKYPYITYMACNEKVISKNE